MACQLFDLLDEGQLLLLLPRRIDREDVQLRIDAAACQELPLAPLEGAGHQQPVGNAGLLELLQAFARVPHSEAALLVGRRELVVERLVGVKRDAVDGDRLSVLLRALQIGEGPLGCHPESRRDRYDALALGLERLLDGVLVELLLQLGNPLARLIEPHLLQSLVALHYLLKLIKMQEEKLQVFLVVRTDLGMTKGKICA